ncbi:MAG: hypothetical protein Q9M40_13400 [Sulfurimonas sp.]|nr:hypothetical protein [Sulfurimonas sp.]
MSFKKCSGGDLGKFGPGQMVPEFDEKRYLVVMFGLSLWTD